STLLSGSIGAALGETRRPSRERLATPRKLVASATMVPLRRPDGVVLSVEHLGRPSAARTRSMTTASGSPPPPAPNGRHTGSVAAWDRAWKNLADDDPAAVVVFTRGRPRTVRQLYQRAYFEDLWALMGGRAKGARYLELGCGRGTTSMYLASRGC